MLKTFEKMLSLKGTSIFAQTDKKKVNNFNIYQDMGKQALKEVLVEI